MKIRPKTVRRLLLIAAAAGASAAIVGAAFTMRRQARETELANARVSGLRAFETGDVVHAIPALTSYVTARPDDVDAIYALACAQMSLETAGRNNLFDARSRLQQILARQPDHLPAKRQLMKIYERTRLPRELLALSDDVLKSVPGDAEATRARAIALVALERDADALPAWTAYLALVPTDFRAQAEMLATMKRAGRPADELVAYARSNVEKWPDDSRFLLPLATALGEADRETEARAMLESLAQKPQTDPAFVVDLAAALDRARSFDAAEHLLARSADALKSSSLNGALVERMWQNGRHAQVIAATDGMLNSSQRDANLLALRALSLAAVGRRPEALGVARELGKIRDNPEAIAWSAALAIEFDNASLPPSEQVRRLREGLDHDPDNGILYAWLGRALRRSGEPEQAARCLREAAQRLPSWATPCIELADTMLEIGRVTDAAAAAKAAYFRAPTSAAVQLQVARVRFAELNSRSSPADVRDLLARIDALLRAMPGEATLPAMRVTLLASNGQREAAESVAAAAAASLPHEANLQPLFDAARHAGLRATSIIFDRAAADHAVTPTLAIGHANDIAAQPDGGVAAAVQWIASQAAAHKSDPAWALAEARTRQALDDPKCAETWKQIVESFPGDRAIQSAALAEAADLVGDRQQQAAIVERIKIIAGDDSSTYRIARARWLGASSDDTEARQALTLAADLVRAQPSRTDLRVLLARVLVRLDSAATAIDHLRSAHDQAPSDTAIALELADTLRRAGRWNDSVAVVKAQAAYDAEDPNVRAALAQSLIDAGAFDEATQMLKRAAARGPLRTEEQLLNAAALDANGDVEGASAAYASVSAGRNAPPSALASAAAFERRQGHLERATALIERIDRSDAPADDRVRAIAHYASDFGETELARGRYAGQISTGTAGVDLWLDAIALETAQGDLKAAGALADRAAEQFPSEGRIKRASIEIAARRAGADGRSDAYDALIASMASDPTARREVAALRALQHSGAQPTPELATRLAALADAYPSSIDLSRRAIDAALATNQPQIAGAIARRLMSSAATRADALELATKSLYRLHDLPTARRAAERWRATAAANPREADVALAQIALADGAVARALTTLEPYRTSILWTTDDAVPTVLAEALARSNRAADAFALLEPGLTPSRAARAAWLRVIGLSGDISDNASAKLARLEAATPTDATDEQVRLGGAYLDLAQANGNTRDAERGAALLVPLEASGRLAGNGRALLAELQRMLGSGDQAQATLREALRTEPDNAMVKNSLAYLLLNTPGGVDEACRLASEAVAAMPNQPAFHDTLARALLASHQSAKAEASFRQALKLDDGCLDAWVGLARLQAQAGRLKEAQASMQHVDASLSKSKTPDGPPHLRAELRTVRETVASARD